MWGNGPPITWTTKLTSLSDLFIRLSRVLLLSQDQDHFNQTSDYLNVILWTMSIESGIRFLVSLKRLCSGSSTHNRKISFRSLLQVSCEFADPLSQLFAFCSLANVNGEGNHVIGGFTNSIVCGLQRILPCKNQLRWDPKRKMAAISSSTIRHGRGLE